jgi:hypothetical protein
MQPGHASEHDGAMPHGARDTGTSGQPRRSDKLNSAWELRRNYVGNSGHDGPDSGLLIETATTAKRAVSTPEFVDLNKGGLVWMPAPSTDFCGAWDRAADLDDGSAHHSRR